MDNTNQNTITSAARNLIGEILEGKWHVVKKFNKAPSATGGNFSVCYEAEYDGEKYFVKVIDIEQYVGDSINSIPFMEAFKAVMEAYNYEKDLSEYCSNHYTSKVACVVGAGQYENRNFTYPIAPYLVFEMADSDVRTKIDYSTKIDFAWKLKSLHDIATGIKQLHAISVNHQDLKPSNILLFKNESKIGDLGRSICTKMACPYTSFSFAGDRSYAPPEYWLNLDYHQNLIDRNNAIDCYMLGSLITFYIVGMSMTSCIEDKLHVKMQNWILYDMATIYNAFSEVLLDIRQAIPIQSLQDDIVNIIEILCNPDPTKRIHPKNYAVKGNKYNLERFIQRLDLLHEKAKVELFKMHNNGCKN